MHVLQLVFTQASAHIPSVHVGLNAPVLDTDKKVPEYK